MLSTFMHCCQPAYCLLLAKLSVFAGCEGKPCAACCLMQHRSFLRGDSIL